MTHNLPAPRWPTSEVPESEREAAGDLTVGWAAFGRFCRERCGVEPQVLLGAWRLGVHEEPNAEDVVRFLNPLGVLWERRVGGGT